MTKPHHEIRLGTVRATIWQNEGTNGATLSVSFSRLYKDEKTEQWADSTSFRKHDLLLVAKVADLAHSYVLDEEVKLRGLTDNE